MFVTETMRFKDIKENERFFDLNMVEYIKDSVITLNAVRVLDNHRIHFEPNDIIERRR